MHRLAADCPVAALVHANPHATFARIAALLHPAAALAPGVHPAAIVRSAAPAWMPRAQVGAFAVIGPGAVIGPRCLVGAHAVVGAGGVAGRRHAAAGAGDGLRRRRASVSAASCIRVRWSASDGFGNARDGGHWVKVPQVGGVLVGDDVEIGANTTIDRGALGDTVIEEGVRLDNQIQIAHNVVHRRAHGHRRLHRHCRQHPHRQALHDRWRHRDRRAACRSAMTSSSPALVW